VESWRKQMPEMIDSVKEFLANGTPDIMAQNNNIQLLTYTMDGTLSEIFLSLLHCYSKLKSIA